MNASRPARFARRSALLSAIVVALVLTGTSAGAVVSNDNLADAVALDVGQFLGSYTGDNTGATKEDGEPTFPELGDFPWVGSHSVWFAFTPSANGRMVLDTVGSAFDTVLTVYTDATPLTPPSFGDLTVVAYNETALSSDGESRVVLDVVAATPYYVALGGVMVGEEGAYRLNWRRPELSRVLWQHTTGAAVVWTLDDLGKLSPGPVYGPFSGWQPAGLTIRNDQSAHILWRHDGGAISIWTVDRAGSLIGHTTYGPYPGWTALDMEVGAYEALHVSWKHSSGALGRWRIPHDPGEAPQTYAFGPYPGWQPVATTLIGYFFESDGTQVETDDTRVLWSADTGAIGLWVEHYGFVTQFGVNGPFTGWTALDVAAGSRDGNTRILWRHAGGAAGLWRQLPDGSVTSTTYGPFSGWEPVAVATGNGATVTAALVVQNPSATLDGDPRILWRHTSGQMALWRTNVAGERTASFTYGPFAGWTAVDVAVGPE